MALERELATYRANLSTFLDHEGEFVVIQGEEVAGFWQTYEDALKAAYERYGLGGFMVKQVFAVEPVHFFSGELPRCRT